MRLTRRLFVLTGAASTAAACASAQAPDGGSDSAARAFAADLHRSSGAPALSLAAMRGDELLCAEAWGQADVELAVTATPAHRFRLGSVSKIVAASLTAKLAEAGIVDLDAPIARYMPDLPEHHRATTLRQLLTHRGGVRHYIGRDFSSDGLGPLDARSYASAQDILDAFINDPLIAAPGETVFYSTFGYTLASLVIESAAGASFDTLVQREICAPLGLASLGFDAPRRIEPGRVSGYNPAPDGAASRWVNAPMNNPAYKWAGGGMIATPADIARFGAAHLRAGVFGRRTLDEIFRVHTEATDRSPPLGLGWRIDRDASGRLRWHHAGVQDGTRASLVVYPEAQLSIAFATNLAAAPGDVLTPSAQLADIFGA